MPGSQTRNFALGGVVLVIAGFLLYSSFGSVKKEKDLRIQKEAELAQKVTELAKKDSELTDLGKQRSDLEQQLKSAAGNVEAMARSYDAKLKELSDNVEMLARDNAELTKYRADAQKKINQLAGRVKELETDKYDLLEQIKKMQQEPEQAESPTPTGYAQQAVNTEPVELGDIVVQKNTGQNVRVQHVDPLYGFVVFSAGSRDGMRKGQQVVISRDGQMVSKAVVERARENVSAAVLMPEWTQAEVREGDLVSRG